MKKIVTFVLALVMVLSMFTLSFAQDEAEGFRGCVNYTGEWEVVEGGLKSHTHSSIFVFKRTAKTGTFEITMGMSVIKAGGMPGIFLQGTGFENVTELGDQQIEKATTDSIMIWPQAKRVVITDMNMGQYREVHTFITYAEVFGEDWLATAEKITFKFEFEDGYLKTYFKDTMDENAEYILAAESTYSAKGDQIAIRGKITTDSNKNYLDGQTFLDMKINGVDAFEEPADDPVVDDPTDGDENNENNENNENLGNDESKGNEKAEENANVSDNVSKKESDKKYSLPIIIIVAVATAVVSVAIAVPVTVAVMKKKS
jgi:hypothetical protein